MDTWISRQLQAAVDDENRKQDALAELNAQIIANTEGVSEQQNAEAAFFNTQF